VETSAADPQHISHTAPPQPASDAPNEDACLGARNKIRKLTHAAAEGRGNDASAPEEDAGAAGELGGANAQEMDKMAVASLLELMHAGSAPARSKKRSRDPASGGGKRARKKTALVAGTSDRGGAQSQGTGKSPLAAAEGSGVDPCMKKPQSDVASGGSDAAGGGQRVDLAGQDEREAESVHPSPMDTDAVMKELEKAQSVGEINPNSSKRLKALHQLLHSCYEEGLLRYETPSHDPGSARLSPEACILGWSKLLVKEPKQFNLRIRQMVDEDKGGIWKKANGKYKQQLKNPTWGVYELFRKIGVKPRFRGPAEGDFGKQDMFYYKEWEFKNDESFKRARLRLAKGFSYCPEKGNRARKRAPKQDLS